MNPPPETLDGARVLRWVVLGETARPRGATRHIVDGQLQGPCSVLAICRYAGADGYYLFGCDESWKPITDTQHETLEEALAQADFEYEGLPGEWNVI